MEGWEGSRALAPGAALPLSNSTSSSVVLGEALPENCKLHRRAAGALPQLLLSPCWIKKEETSLGCTCVERRGAVRSALDRIFRDLNRREYDSINHVLVTLPVGNITTAHESAYLGWVNFISDVSR